MDLLGKLQKWYQEHCDSDWEHSFGIKLETLDNPGWRLQVNLALSQEKSALDW